MEYFLGFSGYFRLNKQTPVTVLLENRGKSFDGTLEISVKSGSEYHRNIYNTLFSKHVTLPSGSKKIYTFTIRIISFAHPLTIRLKQDSKTVLSSSVNLRNHCTFRRMVILAGQNIPPGVLSVLSDDIIPINVRPVFLPENWHAYEGTDMLILQADVLDSLRQKQFIALAQWVEKGGFLILTGSLNYGIFSKQRIQRLIKINILGTEQVYELKSLETFCGYTLSGHAPFLVLKTDVKDSLTLARENDIPIIVQKETGGGRILFLAFDYRSSGFMSWPGRSRFWKKILSLKPPKAFPGKYLMENFVLSAMTKAVPLRFPGFIKIFIIISAYIILAKIIFSRIEKKGKPLKNLTIMLVIIAIFSAAGYWFVFYKNVRNTLACNSFLHIKKTGHMLASYKNIVGMYALQNSDIEFSFGNDFQPVIPVLADRNELGKETGFFGKTRFLNESDYFNLHENTSGHTVRFSMNPWSRRFCKMESKMEIPILGKAFTEGQDLIIEIDNQTPYTITGCNLFFADRIIFLDKILPHKKQKKRIPNSLINQKKAIQHVSDIKNIKLNLPGPLYKSINENLMKEILSLIYSQYNSKSDTLCLFGWIQPEVMPIKFTKPGLTGEHAVFLEWRLLLDKT
ncbi:MAG: hypothetical protein GY795_32925 [Desulfobacterales bacterium]|nr:hypothetical protein [Desulfobacterales bacterium]